MTPEERAAEPCADCKHPRGKHGDAKWPKCHVQTSPAVQGDSAEWCECPRFTAQSATEADRLAVVLDEMRDTATRLQMSGFRLDARELRLVVAALDGRAAAVREAVKEEREAAARLCEDEAHRQNRWLKQEMESGTLQNVDFRHGARTAADRCAERIRKPEVSVGEDSSTNDLCKCGHYRRRHVLDSDHCTRCDPEVPCPSFVLARGPEDCLGGVVHEADYPRRARGASKEKGARS